MEPGDSLMERLLSFSKGHAVLDRDEQKAAHRLAEGVVFFLQHRFKQVVEASETRALLYWYANDGTPMLPAGQVHSKPLKHPLKHPP